MKDQSFRPTDHLPVRRPGPAQNASGRLARSLPQLRVRSFHSLSYPPGRLSRSVKGLPGLQSLTQREQVETTGGSEIGYVAGQILGYALISLGGWYHGAAESAKQFQGAFAAH